MANKALGWWFWSWRLLPLHIEFLLMGWTAQLVMGVAFWIMPRFEGVRRRESLAWAGWAVLNAGLLWKTAVALLSGPPALAGQALELVGVALYGVHLWPRVKPLGV